MASPIGNQHTYTAASYNAQQTCSQRTIQALKITGFVLALLAIIAASVLLAIFSPPVAVVYTTSPYYLYTTPYFVPFL